MDLKLSTLRDESLETFLTDRLKEYNNYRSPAHLEIRKEGAVTPFYAVFHDEGGVPVAGLGTALMDCAEREAATRGCSAVYLTTFGFLAPAFYQSRGYRVLGIRENYPPGVTYYRLQKDL